MTTDAMIEEGTRDTETAPAVSTLDPIAAHNRARIMGMESAIECLTEQVKDLQGKLEAACQTANDYRAAVALGVESIEIQRKELVSLKHHVASSHEILIAIFEDANADAATIKEVAERCRNE